MADVGEAQRISPLEVAAAVTGLVLMVLQSPFFLAAGLIAPWWGVLGLILAWAVLVALGLFWFRTHPYRVLALPVVAAVIWFTSATIGDVYLGWHA